MRINYFTAPRKVPKFQLVTKPWMGPDGRSILRLSSCRGSNFKPNQICFCFSLDKVFHLPEFKEKIFLARKWVGGFYGDSLLNLFYFKYLNTSVLFPLIRQSLVFTLKMIFFPDSWRIQTFWYRIRFSLCTQVDESKIKLRENVPVWSRLRRFLIGTLKWELCIPILFNPASFEVIL